MNVTKAQITVARRADLHSYLLANCKERVKREGKYLIFDGHHSLSIKEGFSGYCDFSPDADKKSGGNPIDFLVEYLNFSFPDAVMELQNYSEEKALDTSPDSIPRPPKLELTELPKPTTGQYKRAYAYLTVTRRLSRDTVAGLIKAKLLYQDERGNAVFISKDKTFCEVRGTLSEKAFHQSLHTEPYTPFWSVTVGSPPQGSKPSVFVCESCIDAVSLYELQRLDRTLRPGSIFCGIGGVGKQIGIDAIAQRFPDCVWLAVDNDSAGEECRKRNPSLPYILPEEKDWNEILKKRRPRETR